MRCGVFVFERFRIVDLVDEIDETDPSPHIGQKNSNGPG